MFHKKEVPYLFVLLVGIIGFFINQVLTNVKAAPIIAYNFENVVSESKTTDKVWCTIENISESTRFDTIRFLLKYPSAKAIKNKLFNPEEIPVHPASIGQDQNQHPKGQVDSTSITYTLINFQPQTRYILEFEILHADVANKDDYPFIYLDCRQSLWLEKTSFKTWFVKNQLAFNLITLLIMIILGIVYSFFLKIKE